MSTVPYDKLVQALQKEVKDRTSSDLITICSQIENVNFLKQFIGTHTPEFLEMCQFLKIEEYPSDHVLFKQGDLGDKYYIIVKGKVQISINIPQGKGKNLPPKLKEVGQIGVGMSFGELALLFNSIRNATIQTVEESAFIVLTKDIFANYMKFKTPPNAEEILKFFDQLECFQAQKLALPQKIQIVSKCDTKNYVSNAALILQGKPVDSLNFIKKGLTKIYRKVKFKVNPLTGEIDPKECKDPSESDIERGYFKELFLEIDEIYEGNLIGEFELLNYKLSQVTILAYTPTEIISINRSDLSILPEKMVQQFRSNSKPYPPDTKLRKIFFQGLYWRDFKSEVIESMSIETRNRRNIDNKSMMNRDQPYEIPHEAQLHVEEDSFNKDLEENDDDLEKQVFKPLDKLFASESKRNINNSNILGQLNEVGSSFRESKMNESHVSPINISKTSSQNFSLLKSSPQKNKKSKSSAALPKKSYNNVDKIQNDTQNSEYFYGHTSSLKFGSKVALPPIQQSQQFRQSIQLSQQQDSYFSIPQTVPLTAEEKKNIIRRQLFFALDPKRDQQNAISRKKRQSDIKIEEQVSINKMLQPQLDNKRKDTKIVLQRYLTPKVTQRNRNIIYQQDVILTERAQKYS